MKDSRSLSMVQVSGVHNLWQSNFARFEKQVCVGVWRHRHLPHLTCERGNTGGYGRTRHIGYNIRRYKSPKHSRKNDFCESQITWITLFDELEFDEGAVDQSHFWINLGMNHSEWQTAIGRDSTFHLFCDVSGLWNSGIEERMRMIPAELEEQSWRTH